jgi:CRP-like cAMP-binding protein
MNPGVVARIEGFVYHREYESRQIVYFPDDPCDFVYWVRQGRVRVTRMSPDNRELSFRHLFPGDMLGEECLIPRARRGDYAEALAPSILCLMRTDDYRRLVREESELALAVAQRLAQRVGELEHVLADVVFKPVRNRVASGLLRLYRQKHARSGDDLLVTHQELANLVGTTRETTTATLHELRKEGLIALANRRLRILDAPALQHIADGD